jgi:hypothetical protein
MSSFDSLSCNGDLKEIINTAFDSNLDIAGAWGYTKELSTEIITTDVSIQQFEHIFASMRAYVEMNMTLESEARYASINLTEVERETQSVDHRTYHKISYSISAIKESTYNHFIKEYKENYGEESFDLNAHFERRKEKTLHRKVIHWFILPKN